MLPLVGILRQESTLDYGSHNWSINLLKWAIPSLFLIFFGLFQTNNTIITTN